MTHIRYLLATSDAEIGKIGPSPTGCGVNRAILRCRPSLGIAKVFVLRLVSHPTDKDPSAGTPVLARFSLATPPAGKLIAGSRACL